jgi:hypothetical protein
MRKKERSKTGEDHTITISVDAACNLTVDPTILFARPCELGMQLGSRLFPSDLLDYQSRDPLEVP